MAEAILAFASRLVCRRPLHHALAQRFLEAMGRRHGG